MDGLVVSLGALKRGPVERDIVFEDAATAFGELPFALARLQVAFRVEREASGSARATGRLEASADVECRKCLAPTPVNLEAELSALFRSPESVVPGEEGVWSVDIETGSVDLTDVVREEIWVAAPEYVECAEDCQGMCPRCGVRLADEACTCPPPEPDPRWAALEGLGGSEPSSGG